MLPAGHRPSHDGTRVTNSPVPYNAEKTLAKVWKVKMHIRSANTTGAADLLDIYAHYVERTAVSFECEVPSLDEFTGRIGRWYDVIWMEKIVGEHI